MAERPSKIHLTTRSYLKSWAPDGVLRPYHRERGRQKLKSPAAVGWQRDWWSQEAPELNAVCEGICNQLETRFPSLLRELMATRFADADLRALFGQFLALHVVRTDAFIEWLVPRRDESLVRHRREFASEAEYEEFCAIMRGDGQRAQRCFGLVNKMATLLSSMSWSFLTFEEPLLMTSDQPVVVVPLLDAQEEAEVKALPDAGWGETLEVRFAINPRLAMLGTWLGPPADGKVIPGRWHHAVNLNTAVSGQASEWAYATPERPPAMLPVVVQEQETVIRPLGPQLLRGYSSKSARDSPLRHAVDAQVRHLIEHVDDKRMVVVTARAA